MSNEPRNHDDDDYYYYKQKHLATPHECEALPGVAYPGHNHSTVNTKTGYDDDYYY